MEHVNAALEQLNFNDILKEDPETNAVWVLRFTSIQFVLAPTPCFALVRLVRRSLWLLRQDPLVAQSDSTMILPG